MTDTQHTLNFSFAAGKVAGVGGFVEDVNLSGGPGSAYVPPGINVQYNNDGTISIHQIASGFVDTQYWYTGGTPSGPTIFSLEVTSLTKNIPSSPKILFGPSSIGTFNTTGFSVAIADTESGVLQGIMSATMYITRNGQTVSHSWQIQARTEI